MAWSWAYLGLSLFCGLLVANAFRPPRNVLMVVGSFFAGWYVGELPLWHLVWQGAAAVGFAYAGALSSWPGWVGLGVSAVSWAGLFTHYLAGRNSSRVFDAALTGLEVPATLRLPRDGRETMWHFPRLANPLPRPVRAVRMIRNIDYAGDGRHRHRLDILVDRANPPGGAPVLVYIHGGAWVIGDKREQGLPMLMELARRGWVSVTVNYSLSPRGTWPEHIVDCKIAINWVRTHIAEYGGDPSFVAVSGGSAGGHLAALAALSDGDPQFQPGFEEQDTSVDACIPFYGVYDMTVGRGTSHYDKGLLDLLEKRVFKAHLAESPEVFEAASPLYRVHAGAPPFFVVHGVNDTLVPVDEARRFVDRLREVSEQPVHYAELPYTQHAFDVLASPRCANAVAASVRFLESVRAAKTSSTLPHATRTSEPAARRTVRAELSSEDDAQPSAPASASSASSTTT